MNDILEAFTNPTVLAGVALTFIVQFLFKYIQKTIRALLRGGRLRELKKIKAIRHYPEAINYESLKALAYYLVFMGSCALFLILITMGPLNVTLDGSRWVLFLVCSPVFIFEILWLNQSMYAKSVIKYRRKLRITKPSM